MRRLLRGGVKGVQIAFVFRQLIKPPLLYDTALFQDQDLVVAPQEGFIQGVGDHDPGQALQIQDGAGHLEDGLGVQGRGGLVYQQDLGVFQQAPGDGDPLLLPAGRSAAVFAAAQVEPNYAALSEEKKVELLISELKKPRLLYSPFAQYSEETTSELRIMRTARYIREQYGKRAITNYIISHTETVSDLLEVYLLQKESGLLHPKRNGTGGVNHQWNDAELDLMAIPLFETIPDSTA